MFTSATLGIGVGTWGAPGAHAPLEINSLKVFALKLVRKFQSFVLGTIVVSILST